MLDAAISTIEQPGIDQPEAAPFVFHDALVAMLPKLRVQALALTRNRAQADDLVQDTVVNALSAQDSFQPGTNFPAWMHRILRNRFISTIRRRREETGVDAETFNCLVTAAPQHDRLVLKELATGLGKLSADQREALVMLVIQGMSYEEIADATGAAVGTAKCRVFRARARLEAMLLGEAGSEADSERQQDARRSKDAIQARRVKRHAGQEVDVLAGKVGSGVRSSFRVKGVAPLHAGG
jgi:RNA polymerase sigma-70 factor (ECF subfamily)